MTQPVIAAPGGSRLAHPVTGPTARRRQAQPVADPVIDTRIVDPSVYPSGGPTSDVTVDEITVPIPDMPVASTDAELLRLVGVSKTYPGSPPLTVLKQVDLSIGAGEDVSVVGPSGSGKTTMLSIMGTLDQPSQGEVWIDGVDVATLPQADCARLRAETIGFVFQQFYLLPTLTAVDNVAEGMLYRGTRRSQRRELAMAALERVGLAARARHLPGQLSGGEQQRVALARAIAGGPRLLFADEPTGALDQTAGHMVVDYLQAVAAEGTTVIVITHDQGLADRFARRIALLDGSVVGDEQGVMS